MQYYTLSEVGKMLKLSPASVKKLFADKPGVIVFSTPKPGRRAYQTMRISAEALAKVAQCSTC